MKSEQRSAASDRPALTEAASVPPRANPCFSAKIIRTPNGVLIILTKKEAGI